MYLVDFVMVKLPSEWWVFAGCAVTNPGLGWAPTGTPQRPAGLRFGGCATTQDSDTRVQIYLGRAYGATCQEMEKISARVLDEQEDLDQLAPDLG
ncbi:hypothetical protein KDL01_27580 [Actinospica durhamensis]|uniref:Uncharacterized protein n=1 Tax=Actinospica durhamensis TaxID=1508375 RepID=A0A941EXZ6_9ACTN|nr:hypothetical protein [Actinospica durhamensis]MBR7837069.1 hypothetical protein [Actinospica durhamensis]